jgi:hypothetical protein
MGRAIGAQSGQSPGVGPSIHFAGPAEFMLFIEAMGNTGLADQTCTRSIPPAKRRQRQLPVDPGSAASLRQAGAGLDVRVVNTDGVAAIERETRLPRVDARDVLVHIDPFEPFERITPDSRTPVAG